MKAEVYVCDECGAQKRTANHWWLIGCEGLDVHIILAPWTEGNADAKGVTHYCGSSCALQAVNRFMESGTVKASSQQLAARS